MTRRKIETHQLNDCNKGLTLLVVDNPGPGGANHSYHVTTGPNGYVPGTGMATPPRFCLSIDFQYGPVPESGINGITNEVLIAILIDRMEGFQRGPFACERNAMVLDHLQKALMICHGRTQDRIDRGVEGKMEP
jgi:hypothetical protein